MITIYHNPRCSKSREALDILQNQNVGYTVVKYLDEPLSVDELGKIIKRLGIPPSDLIRKNESIWKENYKGKELSDEQLINLMIQHPQLMERPIVINGNKAVIGRPPQHILDIL